MNKDTDMPIELNAQQISRICRSVEKSMGHVMSTPRDFDQLCESIFARTGALLSRNTLRRIWGRIDEGTRPRRSTVVILLHFLGIVMQNVSCEKTASERTRLQPGDTFLCNLIIEGEPLYLDQLRQAGNVQQNTTPKSYVCGMDTGVWYEFL